MDNLSDRNFLSELPLSVIHMILARVSIRDAVRTSILSRQWRYTWASLPRLKFEECYPMGDFESRDEFEDWMEDFVLYVLILHKGPIYKFKLTVPFRRNCRDIGHWILHLSRKDIRVLILDMGHSDSSGMQELCSSIYSCKKLTKLVLRRCELDPPPSIFKAFLLLRHLVLCQVFLPTDEVESLVANCPLLEQFQSIDCKASELRIRAPNLKVLGLVDDYDDMSVYAPLLVALSVQLEDDGFAAIHQQQNSSACNYTNFLGGFTNLENLFGAGCFTKYLSMGIEFCQHTLVFLHLIDIELLEVNFEDIRETSVIARLIVDAPNLQNLKIESTGIIVGGDAPQVPHTVSFSDFGCGPDFKLEKLSFVEMKFVTGVPHEMAFMKLLLERSPVLETMDLRYSRAAEKQNWEAELLGFSRASPNAKLLFLQFP